MTVDDLGRALGIVYDHSVFADSLMNSKVQQPRRVSVHMSYTPRNAASSFFKTTTPIPDEFRESMRHSLRLQGMDSDDFTNMSLEQQAEWKKLKQLIETTEDKEVAEMSL